MTFNPFEPQIASGEDGFDPFAALLLEPYKLAEEPSLLDSRPIFPQRRSSSTSSSTPFEDPLTDFLNLFGDEDASATPALVFDDPMPASVPTNDAPLFTLPDAASPAFAFRNYAPFAGLDSSLSSSDNTVSALKTPPAETLAYTCSPVELTADSPPFDVERPLPSLCAPAAGDVPVIQSQSEKEEETVQNSRKRKSSAKFTGTRSLDSPLVDVDAPVASRKYLSASRTSRKAIPVLYQRQAKKQKVDVVDEAGEILPEHADAIENKRLANTIAARRSRQRKAEHLKTLEMAIESLQAELEAERAKSQRLEAENAAFRQRIQ